MNNLDALLSDAHAMEVKEKADWWIERGWKVYFKWTCAGCGDRAVADTANSLHTSYRHDECGHETPTIEGDLGFLTASPIEGR